jgi:hypothetical protein
MQHPTLKTEATMNALTVNKLTASATAKCGYYLCAYGAVWHVEIPGSWVGPQTYCEAHLHIGCEVLAEWDEEDPAKCQLPSRMPRKNRPEPEPEPDESPFQVVGTFVATDDEDRWPWKGIDRSGATDPMFEADVYTQQGVQGRLV